MRRNLTLVLERIANWLIYLGGVIVLIQAVWITYGVFMRYVLDSPDGMVTEATALMLVPVAFLGLAYALSRDAYPKVTILRDRLPEPMRAAVDRFNLLIMVLIGTFFCVAATEAAIRAYHSGAASEILLWPRFYFWIPVSISLIIFTLLALARLISYRSPGVTHALDREGV